jgi:alpha-tubulin suppressor-like RCC1 family protein
MFMTSATFGGRAACTRALRALSAGMLMAALAACGGGGDTSAAPPDGSGGGQPGGAALARLEVTPSAITFTAADAQQQLTVRGFDAAGVEVKVSAATFNSSDTRTATVGPDGLVRVAGSLGSSLIDVRVGSVVAPPVTVLALRPADGVLLVTDDQIAVAPAVVGTGDATRVRVGLARAPALAVGALLLGTGQTPLGGRVTAVSTDGATSTVDLEDVPITALVRDLSMALTYTPEQVNALSAQLAAKQPAAAATPRAASAAPRPNAVRIGTFECESAIDLSVLQGEFEGVVSPPDISFAIAHEIVDGDKKRTSVVARGTVAAQVKGVFRLGATFDGEVQCKMPLARLVAPIFGVASLIVVPMLPLNVEFDLNAQVSYAGFSFGNVGNLGADAELGFDYVSSEGAKTYTKFDTHADFQRIVSVPTDQGPRAKITLFGGLTSGLDLSFGNIGILSFTRLELLKVAGGPELEAKLTGPYGAVTDTTFDTGYELTAKLELQPGEDIEAAIEKLLMSPKAIEFSLKEEVALAHSPTAKALRVEKVGGGFDSAQSFAVGDSLKFKIELDPAKLAFPLFDYNVAEVRVYRVDYGSRAATLVATATPASAGQASFELPWTADVAGRVTETGDGPTFFAFVVDVPLQLVSRFVPLELGPLTTGPAIGQTLAGTGTSTMTLAADGRIFVRGTNNGGALGVGAAVAVGAASNGAIPMELSDIVSVSGGAWHGIALDRAGDVYAWGWGPQIGYFGTNNPVPTVIMHGVATTAISSGYSHSLALRSDGSVWGFGIDVEGSLGGFGGLPADTGLGPATAVAAGGTFSLALHTDGTVWAIGSGVYGELGDGRNLSSATPVQVKDLTDVVAIAAGGRHALALTRDGRVWAWGYNANGRLGDGTGDSRSSPVLIQSLSGVTKISADENHSMALANGVVYTWGLGQYGRLGTGDEEDRRVPTPVLSGAVEIDAAEFHSLARLATGELYGWGYNRLQPIAQQPAGDGVKFLSPVLIP